MNKSIKKILGLDLGTNSIGWALVKESQNKEEQSKIIKLGVRVINYDNFSVIDRKSGKVSDSKKTDEDFAAGKGLSPNASRTSKRAARRNLQRFKLRRKNLIEILIKSGFITKETPLTEVGKNTTHQTLELRAKSAKEQIPLESLAKVFLAINKKRGYKSSRKASNEEEGQAIDGMGIAKELYDSNQTPGQYVLNLLENNKKYIPDFYRSDLQAEFDKVWQFQQQFYPEILDDELYQELQGKNKGATWKVCEKPFNIVGIKVSENGKELKGADLRKKKYELRTQGISEQLDLELLAIVLQEINNNLNQSSGYLGAISDRSKELYFNKETVGENLWHQIQKNRHTSLRNQVFYRQDYLDEFEQIWETQAQFYPQLTNELKEEIRDVIIFYQRKLKSQKSLLSFCQFESKEQTYFDETTQKEKKRTIGRRVISKSSPLFQEFKIWQNLNNVEFTNEAKKEQIVFKELDEEIRREVFEELNVRGNLKSNEVLKLLSNHLKIGKTSDWKCNFKEIEGNRTNKALYNVYQNIADNDGYGHDWARKNASAIKEELKAVFSEIGINTEILEFDTNLNGEGFDKRPAYQLWHLLYSVDEDDKVSEEDKLVYGNSSVSLKKKLNEKFGFKPEYTKLLANISLQQDYGNLSSKAIRKIVPYLQEGHLYSEACELAGYNHSHSISKERNEKRELIDKLELLSKNSLRNPVVEKILNQMVNVVNQIIDEYGKPDEIRVELARELKKNAKERGDMTKNIADATRRNDDIKKKIRQDFKIPNPTKNDVIRYRLYEELSSRGHHTLFADKYIPYEKLFSKDVDIEHVIPKALLFDDSFSNKTLAYREINLQKKDRTALDFITDDFKSDLENYKGRVEALYDGGKGAISKAKRNKLLMSQNDLPEGFIKRDLRNSQYIAKKAKQILQDLVREPIVSTSGNVTDKLREDWDLINVMKELNLPKYKALGLTEFEERLDKGTGKLKKVEIIKDWTKRNDHRHHAMDALTVAFTTHNHIQYLNNLNARKNESHKKHSTIFAIEKLITDKYERKNGKKKRKFIPPMENFRSEAQKHIESILISIKNKNKVVTRNVNIHKVSKGESKKLQLTPRGQLHKETIYGKSKRLMSKPIKLNKRFTLQQANLIADPIQKEIVLNHLNAFENKPIIAFDAKTIKKTPIIYKGEPLKEVMCYEEIFTIRKDISPDLKIDKVVDKRIQEVLRNRLAEFNNKPKEAFSNLDKNPIWLNKEKGISIKRVTIRGVSNAEPLHYKKDHLGRDVLDAKGNKQAVDFVSTGNNHHIAIYLDKEGKLQDNIVSFYEAVERANQKLPIVDKKYNSDLGWQFLFTMKQNEMFVFPNEDFDISEIDLLDENKASEISKHLYRVQKISKVPAGNSFVRDFVFRHHLETTVKDNKQLKGVAFIQLKSLEGLRNIVKVRINHIGKIVQIGEY